LGLTGARLSAWREQFLQAGQLGLRSRDQDARDEEVGGLKGKVGELTMENELLYQKIDVLEGGLRPPPRRPRP